MAEDGRGHVVDPKHDRRVGPRRRAYRRHGAIALRNAIRAVGATALVEEIEGTMRVFAFRPHLPSVRRVYQPAALP
jgi:hypothetical protein